MTRVSNTQPNPVHAPQPIAACSPRGLIKQFHKPAGYAGAMVGKIMNFKNAAIITGAAERMPLGENDHILEIGYGPGFLARNLLRRHQHIQYTGLDWSPVMQKQATQQNRHAIEQGRAVFDCGDVHEMPYKTSIFDAMVAVNCLHLLADQSRALSEIIRVLKPASPLYLPLRHKHPTRTRFVAPGYTPDEITHVHSLLAAHHFQLADDQSYATRSREVTLVTALSPAQ